MKLYQVSLAFLFLCFLITFTPGGSDDPTQFTGDVSINCGSTGNSAAQNGRKWLGDVKPKLSSLLQLKGVSATSTVIHKMISAGPVPYKTARVSRSQFSYSFQVNPGQKIIRLHFHPTIYRGFKGLIDLFTVEAGPFTLLSNFSASLTAVALGVNTFAKEFCLNIQENQQFDIVFSPENSLALGTYAFVNGIEIISVPASLSYFHDGEFGLQEVGQKSLVYVDNSTALEIIHRINIKQGLVLSTGDFDDMFPKWATRKVDKDRSNTWKIPVEVGFRYLIRLHFSELGLKIAGTGDMIFKILINDMIAHTNSDILKAKDKDNILLYRDYMVMMRGLKKDGKRDLLISLQSYDELTDGHGVLAGFEIVKLSNPDNSLASLNPLPPPQDSPSHTIRVLLSVLGCRNAIANIAITIISLASIVVHKLREIWEGSHTEEEHKPSARAERLCRRFSLLEIQFATENFSDGLLIGKGGFGKVYKGLIDKGEKIVAVKRLKSNSKQGAREFLTEIETLCELRHVNLVSLIGYCSERREMILVYEYMACGTLADHLYKLAMDGSNCSSLTWKQRLNICIGAARGLDYLHTGHRVIHRDVKATNILLDENLEAKVSDFGLAKHEDRSRLESHVSTKVKGTFGYFDPYYFSTRKLTTKSDTYAFGVVLLEAFCGRPAVDPFVAEDERILTTWARDKISKGEVDQIVASNLREEVSPNSLKVFVEVAERCLHDEPKERPTMAQVVVQLVFALEQQESRKFAQPNHIADVANYVHPSNENIVSFESAEQSTQASTDLQFAASASTKRTNLNYSPAEKRDRRKPKTHRPLWFWDAFWNRVKPSKKEEVNPAPSVYSFNPAPEFCSPEICEVDIKLPKIDLTTIAAATNQFSASHKIGVGGSSSLYKAVLPTGLIVAVKRFSISTLDLDKFKNEILLVPSLRHENIIKLLGYCVHEQQEMILVYDYMAHGNLRNHLYNSENSPLTWKRRLQICIGVAKGLHYLHTSAKHTIIHRNVKSTNILLDEEWVAKLSDFGLSKVWPDGGTDTYVSTVVKGTFRILDQEYFRGRPSTDKSDVYSFGVVLFEVLCARLPLDPGLPREQVNLAEWAKFCFKEGRIEQIIDSNLKGQIAPECLSEFAETAAACLSDIGIERPPMIEVLWRLEYAMQLQKAAE